MGRLSEESGVVQLVAAVKEHKKFKQLACYSIDTITKNISPPNTYWRSALWGKKPGRQTPPQRSKLGEAII